MTLQALEQRALVWRGGGASPARCDGVRTGFAALDAALPGRGWPRGALTEILAAEGTGAVSLLMPALARLCATEIDHRLAFVAPPHRPYAPALAAWGIDLARVLCVRPRTEREHLWALEQCLRSGACAAVLGWFAAPPLAHLRRLQLAAEAGGALACLFYPPAALAPASPAALRLAVTGREDGLTVKVLKCRGGWPGAPVHLPHSPAGVHYLSSPAEVCA